jgi:hypothetical protein
MSAFLRDLRAVAACAALLAFGATGCDRVEFETNNTTKSKNEGSSVSSLGGPNAPTSLLQRVAAARQTTVFQGVRLVELHFEDDAGPHAVVVRERVSADGRGAFAIEALEVVEPPMTVSQYAVFLSLQSLREGMNWRYRDFSIDGLGLFLQNYTAVDTGNTVQVAGFAACEWRVERSDASGSKYTLRIDPLTGLVLQAREESQEGTLISEMTYESLSFAPDLSGVVWHQSVNQETDLPTVGLLARQVGFEPRAPRTLPAGFQLLERTRIVDPLDGSLWVKMTYGDGLENLFFLHGGPIVGDNGIHSGVPEIQADLVEVAAAAPWIVARGNLRGERVLLLGKVTEDQLIAMLRSAME